MRLLEFLRQWTYPPEYRIPESSLSRDIRALLESVSSRKAGLSPDVPEPEPEQEHLLADLGTSLWRLRSKMMEPKTGQPLGGMREAYFHVEAMWDALGQSGVAIDDHARAPYDSGMMHLEVIAFTPTPGLDRERVIETIRPTVYYRKKAIQAGQVVVGRPDPAVGPFPSPPEGPQQPARAGET